MKMNLTAGSIEAMMTGAMVNRPVVQILALKQMAGAGVDRYRLMLSDGIYSHTSAMLATQLNDSVNSGELCKFAVIRIEKYNSNTLPQDRRVIIVLEFSLVGKASETIGNPQPFRSGGQQAGDGGNDGMKPTATSSTETNHVAPSVQQPTVKPASNASSSYSAQAAVNSKPLQSLNNTASQQQSSFYGAAQPQSRSVVPSAGSNMGSPVAISTPSKINSIASLTPYQNRWTIKARVTNKSQVRSWSNSRGEGKLFSINLADESGEIRATAFRESVDKFYNFIEVNKVYYVSKMQLKTANKQFSSLSNDYEMTFTNETQFIPCEDDDVKLPTIHYNFIPFAELDKHQPNSTIDCIGIVKSVSDIQTIITKQTNRETKKRDIQLVDQSMMQVRITLWGADAETFDGSTHPVLAVKGCRLSDFGGRSLSSLMSSVIIVNPDINEAHKLRGWYDRVGHSEQFNEYQGGMGAGAGGQAGSTNWKSLSDVKAEKLGTEKADFFTSKATIVFSKKENALYMACSSSDCNKKVIDLGNGLYRCEKCNKEFPNFKWRLLLQMNIADATDNTWATCFQDTAEIILGKSAEDLGNLKQLNDGQMDHVFQEANFKSYIFKFRAKMETFNDESRLKLICSQAAPVDFREYNKKLIADIEKMI